MVRSSYITSITKKWQSPAQILCNQVYNVLFKHVKSLIHDHFASFGQGNLEQRVGYVCHLLTTKLSHIAFRVILQNHVQAACQRTEARIEWLISLEAHPFTLNEHYLADYKDKFLSFYKAFRQSQRSPTLLAHINKYVIAPPQQDNPFGNTPQPTGIPKILSGLSEVGITGVKPEDIPKLLPPDTMEPALTIMAEVRAYFQGTRL